jgi:hypothetical protein
MASLNVADKALATATLVALLAGTVELTDGGVNVLVNVQVVVTPADTTMAAVLADPLVQLALVGVQSAGKVSLRL